MFGAARYTDHSKQPFGLCARCHLKLLQNTAEKHSAKTALGRGVRESLQVRLPGELSGRALNDSKLNHASEGFHQLSFRTTSLSPQSYLPAAASFTEHPERVADQGDLCTAVQPQAQLCPPWHSVGQLCPCHLHQQLGRGAGLASQVVLSSSFVWIKTETQHLL